jgi:hypothetical protein
MSHSPNDSPVPGVIPDTPRVHDLPPQGNQPSPAPKSRIRRDYLTRVRRIFTLGRKGPR